MLRWILCASALLGLAGPLSAQSVAIPLAAYSVDPAQVSVSGFSSGAFMAQQLGVAYSSRFMGVGAFAGYHYDCRRTQPRDACYGVSIPDISGSRLNMDTWSGNLIDPVANIAHQRIYVFTGTNDNVVGQNAANQVVNLYRAYTASTNIRYDNTIPAGHAFPTDFDGPFPSQFPCGTVFALTNCSFDGAGISLQWFYGTLKPRNTGAPSGSLFLINQGAFAPRGIGMDEVAWLYVPAGCARGEVCKLHVFLHGCNTSYAQIGVPGWADYSGHRMWADTNNIILLFPQTLPDAINPEGCWDQNAYYGNNYDQKGGVQMAAIMGMIAKITSGYQPPRTVNNYEGLFYNAPAESEAGWGINLAHQGDVIFATWFTYDTTGRAWWLTMTAEKTGPNTYAGKLHETHGPAFNSVSFNPSAVRAIEVGDGALTFTDTNNGTFRYTVNGITQTKTLVRQTFGPVPVCTWGAQTNLALATNYQDLWWNAPAMSESGWGINLNHQGDTIFATWFTYDLDGSPLWLVVTAHKTGPGIYSGDLYRTAGARFDAFNPANVVSTKVGTATLTFANGNSATFDYMAQVAGMPSPVTQTKTITREIFAAPGTACQ